jgi:hypothetical protein
MYMPCINPVHQDHIKVFYEKTGVPVKNPETVAA